MELKHGIEKMNIILLLRFNRTFMELKLGYDNISKSVIAF